MRPHFLFVQIVGSCASNTPMMEGTNVGGGFVRGKDVKRTVVCITGFKRSMVAEPTLAIFAEPPPEFEGK